MAQPTFLAHGTEPQVEDSKWLILCRILGAYQNMSGADPANDPNPSDSVWMLKEKINRALNVTININGGGGCSQPVSPTNLQATSAGSTTTDFSWDYAVDPALDFLIKYGTTQGGPYTETQSASKAIRNFGEFGLTDSTVYYAVIVARTTLTCFSEDSTETSFDTTP